jgi:hypothetical protein
VGVYGATITGSGVKGYADGDGYGVEGNGGIYGLYASGGDVAVTAAHNYVYTTPVTRSIFVPASDFVHDTYPGLEQRTSLSGLWLTRNNTSIAAYGHSQIRLPHGATITDVKFLAYNFDGVSRDVTVYIYHQVMNPGGAPGFNTTQVHASTGVTALGVTGGTESTAIWVSVALGAAVVAPDTGWTNIHFTVDQTTTNYAVGVHGFMVTYTYTAETPMR